MFSLVDVQNIRFCACVNIYFNVRHVPETDFGNINGYAVASLAVSPLWEKVVSHTTSPLCLYKSCFALSAIVLFSTYP